MSTDQLVGLAFALIAGLVAAIYGVLWRAIGNLEKQLGKHVDACNLDRAQQGADRAQVARNSDEIKSLRDRAHRLEAGEAVRRGKAQRGEPDV